MALWTKTDLHSLVAARMPESRFIAVSNREPYIHLWQEDGSIGCTTPASGLATALDPIMRASGGIWVAHGSGNADRMMVDRRDHVCVPPQDPSYKLRRVWIPPDIEQDYYGGLSNEGLWPLCHAVFHRPKFDQRQWDSYRLANALFADAVLEEADGGPAFVFIQDYHFGLLPRMLKARNPTLTVAQFWHIPWPNAETFRAFPWKEELLEGLLGNDLLGFHLRSHCQNFLETVDRNVEALIDAEHASIRRAGHTTLVRPFPISIDFAHHNQVAASPDLAEDFAYWRSELGQTPQLLGIGIDRLDYTKGIPERLRALDLLLERHPHYRGKLVFLQVGVPSRTGIAGYGELCREVTGLVHAINVKWGNGTWQPVHLVRTCASQRRLMALHQMADFCVVSSLHDGMNLVAKEFVASRRDEDGVLVLSSFTGSARELHGALLVNPFSCEELTSAMHQALAMPADERQRRMIRMRAAVESNNIYRWAGKILVTLLDLEVAMPAPDTDLDLIMAGAA